MVVDMLDPSDTTFEEWEADANAYGDLDADYQRYMSEFMDEEGSMREMLTFEEFARREYDKFLLEMHQDDALDDEEDPFPGEDEE